MQWSIPHSVSQAREDVDKVSAFLPFASSFTSRVAYHLKQGAQLFYYWRWHDRLYFHPQLPMRQICSFLFIQKVKTLCMEINTLFGTQGKHLFGGINFLKAKFTHLYQYYCSIRIFSVHLKVKIFGFEITYKSNLKYVCLAAQSISYSHRLCNHDLGQPTVTRFPIN